MRGAQGAGPAASRASRVQKQQGWNKRQRCPKKHKPGEMRAQSPLSPASFPQAQSEAQREQFLTLPPSPSLGSTSSPHSCKAREADSLMGKLHLVLVKTRSCSSRTSCLEQAMEQQQLNPGENRSFILLQFMYHTAILEGPPQNNHVAKSVEQHPQCFLLQKAPTRLRRLRLLRMNGTLFVGGWLQSILHSNCS